MNVKKKRLLACLLATSVTSAFGTISVADQRETTSQPSSREFKNKLEAHRERIRKKEKPATIAGKITEVSEATIGTSISREILERRGFMQYDTVKVKTGGKTLNAQLMDEDEYLQLKDDPSWRETVAFDVVCLIPNEAAGHGLTIEGLSGPLGDWLDARRNMRVRISKTY